MQTFSSDSPLNYVQNFPVIASESEEEFDFSPCNIVAGVKISNTLDILQKISYCNSGPFSLLDLYLPANSYRIVVDVFVTLECIHLYILCIVPRFLFWEVSIMYWSHVMP